MKSVVIIGRPNVGKSTLFNRLSGKKRSITDPTSGVTRDLIKEECLLGGKKVTLIDSGGITFNPTGIDKIVKDKSLSTLEDASVIIFLVDCKEVTLEDEELSSLLRPYADKIILTVNKVDTPDKEQYIWNFYSWGFSRVLGISASHARGLGDLEDCLEVMLDEDTQADEDINEESENEPIKIALLGKPNTGKSTLINKLVSEDVSIVSPIAGTTRDTVKSSFSMFNKTFTIVDTAGIRRKSKVEEDVEYYSVNRAIKTSEESDVVLLIIDGMEGITEQDKKIASIATRRGAGLILVLNKIDLFTIKNQLESVQDRLKFLFPILSYAPCIGISAKDGIGIDKLIKEVIQVQSMRTKRISTAEFNQKLLEWQEGYSVPRGKRGEIYKIFYGTQVSVSPVRFLLFVNRAKNFPEVYLSYIKNKIRSDLGLSKIPIELSIRGKEKK